METAQPSAPIITNAGTAPRQARKLFVNIPVWDLQRSIVFFESLGFVFNTQFTDSSATCMLVGTDAYFMLLATDRFAGFASRPMADARTTTGALFAISTESRAEVDALLAAALASGGTPACAPLDHGFMYTQSFYDLDGHHWEVFWMDPSAING
jgi:uncharacterized protein